MRLCLGGPCVSSQLTATCSFHLHLQEEMPLVQHVDWMRHIPINCPKGLTDPRPYAITAHRKRAISLPAPVALDIPTFALSDNGAPALSVVGAGHGASAHLPQCSSTHPHSGPPHPGPQGLHGNDARDPEAGLWNVCSRNGVILGLPGRTMAQLRERAAKGELPWGCSLVRREDETWLHLRKVSGIPRGG